MLAQIFEYVPMISVVGVAVFLHWSYYRIRRVIRDNPDDNGLETNFEQHGKQAFDEFLANFEHLPQSRGASDRSR